MTRVEPTSNLHRLGHNWCRWTEVVGWFARKRTARRWVRPGEYEALHRDLVAACRDQAEADPENAAYFDRLATLAGPWMTTRILEQTDRTLLLDLMEQCRQVDRELNGPKRSRVPWGWIVGAAAAAVVIGLLEFGLPVSLSRLSDWLGGVERTVRLAIRQLSAMQQLLAGGLVATLLLMGVVRYARRI